ncbi:MAG: dihydrofolate reductase [Treponema sp.]|jgi:dihydrofolate reductase|nr:dihydrofolate reductase [Treponema sp.]
MGNTQDIIIIAAMTEDRVIGRDNALPWAVREDMLHFKELTTGCPCVMGRKTWESLPRRPLPGRVNIIISASMKEAPEGVRVCSSLPAAIALCAGAPRVFICGGASIYREALQYATRLELTLIPGQYEGDAFFPDIDPEIWEKTSVLDNGICSFVSYTRKRKIFCKEGR